MIVVSSVASVVSHSASSGLFSAQLEAENKFSEKFELRRSSAADEPPDQTKLKTGSGFRSF